MEGVPVDSESDNQGYTVVDWAKWGVEKEQAGCEDVVRYLRETWNAEKISSVAWPAGLSAGPRSMLLVMQVPHWIFCLSVDPQGAALHVLIGFRFVRIDPSLRCWSRKMKVRHHQTAHTFGNLLDVSATCISTDVGLFFSIRHPMTRLKSFLASKLLIQQ